MTTERRVTVRLEKQLRMKVRRTSRMKGPLLQVALSGTNEKKSGAAGGGSSIVVLYLPHYQNRFLFSN